MPKIPPSIIGTLGPILSDNYTHAGLDALFMQAGFPGDPPEGNKVVKGLAWLRRGNNELPDPLQNLGALLGELMDTEPYPSRQVYWEENGDPRETIRTTLAKDQLTYQRGGHIIGANLSGPSKSLAEALKLEGIAAIEREYERAYTSIASDPGAAVTAACAILEAVCKHYLETEGHNMPSKESVSPLWTETARHLGLSAAQVADGDLRKILSGLFSIADGVGSLRTHAGSAHGHAKKTYRIEPRHARLAVHAAHTMALFILETWDARKKKGPHGASTTL